MMSSKVFVTALVVLLALMAIAEGKVLSKNNGLTEPLQLNVLLLIDFDA